MVRLYIGYFKRMAIKQFIELMKIPQYKLSEGWGCIFLVRFLSPVYRRSLLFTHMSMNVCVCLYWCDLLIREILSGHGQCTPQLAVMKSLLTGRLDFADAERQSAAQHATPSHTQLGWER